MGSESRTAKLSGYDTSVWYLRRLTLGTERARGDLAPQRMSSTAMVDEEQRVPRLTTQSFAFAFYEFT